MKSQSKDNHAKLKVAKQLKIQTLRPLRKTIIQRFLNCILALKL